MSRRRSAQLTEHAGKQGTHVPTELAALLVARDVAIQVARLAQALLERRAISAAASDYCTLVLALYAGAILIQEVLERVFRVIPTPERNQRIRRPQVRFTEAVPRIALHDAHEA